MREPGRTTQRRHILSLLHTGRLTTPISCPAPTTELKRISIPTYTGPRNPARINLLRRQDLMSRVCLSLLGQNTPLWRPPMAAKSTRRSPNCRVHDPSRGAIKTRRIRYNTNSGSTEPTNQRTQLPLYCTRSLGRNHNRLHLHTTNRPKVPNRLLLRKPYGISSRGYFNPNPLRIHRSTNSDNRPWTDIIRPILSGQH